MVLDNIGVVRLSGFMNQKQCVHRLHCIKQTQTELVTVNSESLKCRKMLQLSWFKIQKAVVKSVLVWHCYDSIVYVTDAVFLHTFYLDQTDPYYTNKSKTKKLSKKPFLRTHSFWRQLICAEVWLSLFYRFKLCTLHKPSTEQNQSGTSVTQGNTRKEHFF